MKRPKVLIADDHAIVRDGLRIVLEKEFEIVGTVEDGRSLLTEAARLAPDVALVDITMPVLNGIEATRQLHRSSPDIRVVVLTMHADLTYATELLEAGASGYILKSAPSAEIKTAIQEALAGRTYVTSGIAEEMVPLLLARGQSTSKSAGRLTPRQREVLQLIAEGRTGKEIAGLLCLSPRTVEFHKYKMMQQLGLRSTAELIRYAMKSGVISN